MHIGYLCSEYPPFPHGGIGMFVQLMARELVARGHEVSVVGAYANHPGPTIEHDGGVMVHRTGTRLAGVAAVFATQVRLAATLKRAAQRRPFDLLEGAELSFGLLPWLPRCSRLIRVHGGHAFFSKTLGQPTRFWTSRIERLSFSRADHLCAVSRFAADVTRRVLHLGARPIEILPNPVDSEKFRPRPEVLEEEGLICYTGSLREKKGVRQLIQAMPAIVHAVPAAHLRLQGGDTVDPRTGRSVRETLEQEIPPEIRGRVGFCGSVPHDALPHRNAQASVLVYPSWMETQGIVVAEGMASGKAVVASVTGPGPEIVEHGVDGLLCDPHDPASIADAVIRCLRDREFRETMGRRARLTAVSRFSLPILVDRNLRFYERCAK